MSNETRASSPRGDALPAHLERYLVMWGEWAASYYAGPARVHASPVLQGTDVASVRAVTILESSDLWVVRHVDAAVDALPNPMHRLILYVHYTNTANPAVWRNNQLPRDDSSFDELLDAARWTLVPILRRRGVPL